MRTTHWTLALAFAVATPAASAAGQLITVSSPIGGAQAAPQLSLHILRLLHADGSQFAPALQTLLTDTTARARLLAPTATGSDTVRIGDKSVVVDSAFRAAVNSTVGPVGAAPLPSSPSAMFVRVVAEPKTNSLLIRAGDADWALINQLVVRLDR